MFVMVQHGNGVHLAFEPFGELLRAATLTVEPGASRLVHLTDASSADGRKNFVGTETSPRCQRHKMSTNIRLLIILRRIAHGKRRSTPRSIQAMTLVPDN